MESEDLADSRFVRPKKSSSATLWNAPLSPSIFPREIGTLLDFGSGAGFPGIPIAICRPEIKVTLAESQQKKAAFLEEAVRLLGISSEVFGRRVETMPETRGFDAVALRAVDKMQRALSVARPRASKFLVLITTEQARKIHESLVKDFVWQEPVPLPYGIQSILLLGARQDEPCHRSLGCSTWNMLAGNRGFRERL